MSVVLIIGLVLCGLILLASLSLGGITLLIKLGMIVREARKPQHLDAGNYQINQGREVVSEQRRDS